MELWKAAALPKVKFFFWLALHRRVWTGDVEKDMAFKTQRIVHYVAKPMRLSTTS
jgi:hypothetical protein